MDNVELNLEKTKTAQKTNQIHHIIHKIKIKKMNIIGG